MLSPDFREFAELLASHEVRYLVVGGYAVAYHGHPRYTGDIDFWIERSPENAERILRVLGEFGFGSLELDASTFAEPRKVVQIGRPPNRIDILTDLTGVDFHSCYAGRESANIQGIEVPFISLADLRANKRALGRHQDLADLEKLE